MSEDKENIRTILHQHYLNGEEAADAARNINKGLGQEVIKNRTAQWWFKQFREGRCSGIRKQGSGRPPKVDRRVLAQRRRRNPDDSPAQLAAGLCHKTTAWRWLRKTGHKPLRSKWIPHRLTAAQKAKRKNVCLRLLVRYRRGHLLSNLITCDESWVYYDGTVKGIAWRKAGEEPAMVRILFIGRQFHTPLTRLTVRPSPLGIASKRCYCATIKASKKGHAMHFLDNERPSPLGIASKRCYCDERYLHSTVKSS